MSKSTDVMNPTMLRYEWKDIPWKNIQKNVFKLQKQIYQASKKNDFKTIHNLQRLLINSWAARCLAVRRITQDNQGKKTAGIDGIANVDVRERIILVNTLKLTSKSKPTRRVWIPKPNTNEKRPLGIPTIFERARQILVKMALEPEWEARFSDNCYGFRPGRSAQDAIDAIFNTIRFQEKYVLDADIAKCFDKINHQALLDKLKTKPTIRRMIKAWLKSGVMEGKSIYPTGEGTPQGGAISPLLANIALHGIEKHIVSHFPVTKLINGKRKRWQPKVVFYADDFVILHKSKEVIQKSKQLAEEWLSSIGLELKPSKTRITHTLQKCDDNVGFDFLGFHIRQFPVGKYKSGRLHLIYEKKSRLLGFKTIIKPSKASTIQHLDKLKRTFKTHKSVAQIALIKNLNPVIRGWSQYYRYVSSYRVFRTCDYWLWNRIRRWENRRHSNKSIRWKKAKYKNNGTIFECLKGRLTKHLDTKTTIHIKVQKDRSVYDGDWVYWSSRLGRYPMMSKRFSLFLKRQNGKCQNCNLYFAKDDRMEVHHIDGNHKNNRKDNLELLHRHCHYERHRNA